MCTWLLRYLSAIFLILVSSSSCNFDSRAKVMVALLKQLFVLIQLTLIFVFLSKMTMHNEVLAWLGLHIYKLVKLDKQILLLDFKNIQNNYCYFDGLQANTGYKQSVILNRSRHEQDFVHSRMLHHLEPITFSRMGRWYAGEAAGTRCFKRCEYRTNANTFKVTYYQFTNGFVTSSSRDQVEHNQMKNFVFLKLNHLEMKSMMMHHVMQNFSQFSVTY
jgi:hypothetical protein